MKTRKPITLNTLFTIYDNLGIDLSKNKKQYVLRIYNSLTRDVNLLKNSSFPDRRREIYFISLLNEDYKKRIKASSLKEKELSILDNIINGVCKHRINELKKMFS